MIDQPTVFQAVGETVAWASELIQLEIKLAKAELAEKSVHLKPASRSFSSAR